MEIIERIQWEEILPIWKEELWPDRVSPIEPVSAMKYLGGYNLEIQDEDPIFFGAHSKGVIYGVNSIVRTAPTQFRSRGLWVDPEKRGQGLGKDLLKWSMSAAKHHGAREVWSAPRKSAWPTYESVGFIRTSDWFDEGMEFGPNCYVLVSLIDGEIEMVGGKG